MPSGDIGIEHHEAVSTILLNRPPLNLFTVGMLQDLHAALDRLEARATTRVVVIRGSGTRAFSAGADLNEEGGPAGSDNLQIRLIGRHLVERIETFAKPVVAAVQGWCIGGGTGIAWAADIRVASMSAKFRAGDVYLGMIPTWSIGMVRLVHYIGRNRALDLLLLGEDVDATQALELGLVSRVVADEDFDDGVERIAGRLSRGAPLPFRAIKEAVAAQCREGMDRAALVEEAWSRRILASEDSAEGIAAFKEKRQPNFKGR